MTARLIPAALAIALAICSCRAGAGPGPDSRPLAVTPVDLVAAIAGKCALVASCAHPHDAPQWRSPGACVDAWLAEESDADGALSRCLSATGTCAGVRACLHPRSRADVVAATFCRAHAGAMTGCEGDVFVSCSPDDPDESSAVDCTSLGARCGDLTQPGGLSTRACVDPKRCPLDLDRAWCARSDDLVVCHDGEIERTACKAGAVCREHQDRDGELAATCDGPGHAPCAEPGKSRCDGTRLVACEEHGHFGHEHVVDCARMGLGCSASAKGASCEGPAPRCERGRPTCEAGELVFCAAGQRVRVDCGAIGLGPCEVDGRGLDATCGSAAVGAL